MTVAFFFFLFFVPKSPLKPKIAASGRGKISLFQTFMFSFFLSFFVSVMNADTRSELDCTQDLSFLSVKMVINL